MDRDPSAKGLLAELNGLGRQAEPAEENLLEGITLDADATMGTDVDLMKGVALETEEKVGQAMSNLRKGLRQAGSNPSSGVPRVSAQEEFDPIEEARLKTFRVKNFSIEPDEDLNELMYYFRECVRGIESELRAERLIEHSDLISQVIELKSQVESLADRQAGIVAGIKEGLDAEMKTHRENLLKMLASALNVSSDQVKKNIAAGVEAANNGFKGGLRALVNTEVRIGVGKALEAENELMTSAREESAKRLESAADKTIKQLEAATREKTARMAKGWIQNAVDDFKGLSGSTQYIVIGVFATLVASTFIF